MKYLKRSLVAVIALGAVALGASGASAMPNGLPSATATAPSDVENVRWVCGPYRCWWQPGPWGPGWGWHRPWGWGPGWGWHRPWGWGPGWHRWHRW
jgi:hypothetical protein